jgi:hypothetical protein
MFGAASTSEMSKRVLARDDIEGVKAIYGASLNSSPAMRADEPRAQEDIDELAVGCSSLQGASTGELSFLFLVGLVPLLSRRRRVFAACLGGLFVLVGAQAEASMPAEALSPKLLQRADLVFEGRIISQHSEWRPGDLVVTISQVQVDACLSSTCPALIEVEQLGGEHGDLGVLVSGVTILPKRGTVLLATRAQGATWRLAGEDRGQLYIEREKAGPSQATGGLAETRIRVQTLLSKTPELATRPLPLPPTKSSTGSKGLLRQ